MYTILTKKWEIERRNFYTTNSIQQGQKIVKPIKNEICLQEIV